MTGHHSGRSQAGRSTGLAGVRRVIRRILWGAAPAAAALIAGAPAAHAADAAAGASPGVELQEITVTAQKRAENMQDVPISMLALGADQLQQMNVKNFDDYARLIPSLSFQAAYGLGPTFEHAYMRGVVSGGDGAHSGSQPSVGIYLDEQPVTTIDGNLNVHIYDVQRIEALAGPQGTLYGASSEAGTIRIITNKPELGAFKAGYDLEGNSIDHGGQGGKVEGFINIPISPVAAVRLVGWDEHDAGFIDNVPGSVTFPTSGIVFDNADRVRNDYNTVDTRGGRAALELVLGDNWTVLPQVMGQTMDASGNFAYDAAQGYLKTVKFLPEEVHDSWVQSALTIEGKISDFDITYAGAYLNRNTQESEDYTDYALFYDQAYEMGLYNRDNAGNYINPAQHILGRDHYSKLSNELRVSSPKEWPLRFTAGLFQERQVHDIIQDYVVDNGNDPLGSIAPNDLSVPDWPGSIWLTDQVRIDRDSAVFGEGSWDFARGWTLNAGLRYYTFDNTLTGFYGYNDTISSAEGIATCFNDIPFRGAPCSDLNGRSKGSGTTPKVNLTYKFDASKMVYATWSKGYRPGGVNRNGGGTLPPYKPDYLTNYEVGWKTEWLGNRVRWNGAVFVERWKDFQFSYLGANAVTVIDNAGNAEIRGVESDLQWAVTRSLTVGAGLSFLDAKLTQMYCARADDSTPCDITNEQYAPEGEQLPVTPRFKGNLTARYVFPVFSYSGYVQATEEYVGARWADLRLAAREALGQEPSYAITDFSAGLQLGSFTTELYVSNALDRHAVLDHYAECDPSTCGTIAIYSVPYQPRTVGVRLSQRF